MISVDNVYKTVQRILNKEQRGYFPPNEFNFFADLANTEVFENYFYELSQYKQLPEIEMDEKYGSIMDLLAEKIHVFEQKFSLPAGQVDFSDIGNFYRLGDVNSTTHTLEEVSEKEYKKIFRSPLTSQRGGSGIYYRDFNGLFTSVDVELSYVRKPVSPKWSYTIVNNKPVYDGSSSVDFELHASDLPDIVVKIAGYAGVAIKAADVTQVAAAKETQLDNSEKQ